VVTSYQKVQANDRNMKDNDLESKVVDWIFGCYTRRFLFVVVCAQKAHANDCPEHEYEQEDFRPLV